MSKAKRGTHFVPKAVFRTAFAGVVPVCVAGIACGDFHTGGSTSSTTPLGVSQSCFGSPPCAGSSSTGSAVDASGSTSSISYQSLGVASFSFSTTSTAVDAAPDHTVLSGDAGDAGDARVHDGGDSG